MLKAIWIWMWGIGDRPDAIIRQGFQLPTWLHWTLTALGSLIGGPGTVLTYALTFHQWLAPRLRWEFQAMCLLGTCWIIVPLSFRALLRMVKDIPPTHIARLTQRDPNSPGPSRMYYLPEGIRRMLKCAIIFVLIAGPISAGVFAALGRNPIPRVFFIEDVEVYREINASELVVSAPDNAGRIRVSFPLKYTNERSLPTDLLCSPIELTGTAREMYELFGVVAYTNSQLRTDGIQTNANNKSFKFKQKFGLKNIDRNAEHKIVISIVPKNPSLPPLTNEQIMDQLHIVLNTWNSADMGD